MYWTQQKYYWHGVIFIVIRDNVLVTNVIFHIYSLYYLKMNYLLNSIILNNKFYFEFSFITSTILIKIKKIEIRNFKVKYFDKIKKEGEINDRN